MAMIEARGLTKYYGSIAAVSDLSFSVEPGSVTGFLGPNGAGKTTTLRMLLGLVAPTSGLATISGQRYSDLPHPSHQVGAMLEVHGFHPGRRARDHLRALACAADLPSGRVEEVLTLVGLGELGGQRLRRYSLGMHQRLALAGALLGDPEVLILDEPANGLDPAGVAWLRAFLRRFADGGGTVLVSSHVLAEVDQVADATVILDGGRLVARGPLSDLRARAGAAVVVRSPQADALAGALARRGLQVTWPNPDQILVRGVSAEEVGQAAADAGAVVYEMRTEGGRLEDLFLALTGPPSAGEREWGEPDGPG
jgi:ABC-2 type transport system ATP-binding protein